MRRLERLLGLDTPIVLGPFGGLSSVALTAAVSDGGGLGSFGLYGYSPERIHEAVGALRAATRGPIAVNLWWPRGDEVTPADVDVAPFLRAAEPLYSAAGVDLPETPASFMPALTDQLDAVFAARPDVLSVVFGIPDADTLARAGERGIRVIGAATSVAEAVALETAGVDAVVATGAEAGGHRVSFLRDPGQSLVGTFGLVPQVVDAVKIPVIAAGGIADRRGVAAAFALGASGVQVGTAFLRTRQSAATAGHREAIAAAADTDTVLTTAMSGRLARGIPNRAMRELEATGMIAPFPAQNWLTGVFRAAATAAGDADLVSLWAGQAAGLARLDDAGEVLAELRAGVPA
ncbi:MULTISPECIES: nitronate monooxygenase family protein [Microbacterium]|uniref:NAD(P)H-dependent flavin oxidoreductase n=1 Tax=Microbacterium TaxID=33882 RepID=UPI00277DE211|nr:MULTISPECIES: nitronate monooxygenase [Microbacterium]MDQ1084938.1 nitronate monooxygenase [Microbacterium sp. SORGH_AS_0344]MDQ1169785.1 nitronate monooxygenase [Microbacterium proteolyticum]